MVLVPAKAQLQIDKPVYTNNDVVTGTVILEVLKSIAVESIEVECICQQRLRVLLLVGASPGSVLAPNMSSYDTIDINRDRVLFNASETVFPDWSSALTSTGTSANPAGSSGKPAGTTAGKPGSFTLAQGMHEFPFQFQLPGLDSGLPESFEVQDCPSGYFWSVSVLVKRASKLDQLVFNKEVSLPFLFLPRDRRTRAPDIGERNCKTETFVFKAHGPTSSTSFLSKVASKRIPVRLETTLSTPKQGIAQSPYEAGIDLQIAASVRNTVLVKAIVIRLVEQVFPRADMNEKTYRETVPETSQLVAKLEPNREIDKSTSFNDLLGPLKLRSHLHGSFEDANFLYVHAVEAEITFASKNLPSHTHKERVRMYARLHHRPFPHEEQEEELPTYSVAEPPVPYS